MSEISIDSWKESNGGKKPEKEGTLKLKYC